MRSARSERYPGELSKAGLTIYGQHMSSGYQTISTGDQFLSSHSGLPFPVLIILHGHMWHRRNGEPHQKSYDQHN